MYIFMYADTEQKWFLITPIGTFGEHYVASGVRVLESWGSEFP